MGVIIYPEKIVSKVTSMDTNLSGASFPLALARGTTAIVGGGTGELSGQAWSSARDYYQNIQLPLLDVFKSWIEEQKGENASYSAAASALPQDAMLCEETIKSELADWKMQKAYYVRLESFKVDYRVGDVNGGVSGVSGKYLNYFVKLSQFDDIIKKLEEKLEKINTFVSTTNGLYGDASGLLSALSNAKNQLGKIAYNPATGTYDYSKVDETWIVELSKAYLRNQGITDNQIKNMEELDYTAAEIAAMWKNLETDEDKQFFSCLMLGTKEAYEQAFGIHPDLISGFMDTIAADYALRIFIEEDGVICEQFLNFNNAILGSTQMYRKSVLDEYTDMQYADLYLMKLAAATGKLLEADAGVLGFLNHPADMNSAEGKAYAEAYDKYLKKMELLNLWTTESIAVEKIRRGGDMEGLHLNISNMKYDEDGNLEFDLKHFSGALGREFTESFSTKILRSGSDIEDEIFKQKMAEIARRQEDLMQELILSALKGTGMIALAATAPELAFLLSAVIAAGDYAIGKKPGKVDTSIITNKYAKVGVNIGQETLINIVNYFQKKAELDALLTAENKSRKDAWFGAGGAYLFDGGKFGEVSGIAFTDLYNPNAIAKVMEWQQSGISKITGWSDESIKKVYDNIKGKTNMTQEEKDLCGLILNGASADNPSKVYDYLGQTDYEKFEALLEKIQTAYNKMHPGQAANIKNSFGNAVNGQ